MKKKSKKDRQNPTLPNSETKTYGDQIMKLISEMDVEEKNQTIELINALLEGKNRVH